MRRVLLAVIVVAGAVLAFSLLHRHDDSLRLQVQVSGTVSATQVGAGGQYRATGTGVADVPFGNISLNGGGSGQTEGNCVLFDGTGELVTAAGTLQLRLAKPGKACVTEATLDQATGGGDVRVDATVEASATDGSLLGRHGSLRARGTYNVDDGTFTVSFGGRLRR
jgi:hypothetical protein